MSHAAAAPPALPDINAETNPFELVEHLLDQAAYFNFLSVPRPGSGAAVEGMGGARGIEIAEDLRRFVITMGLPTEQCGLQARNSVGEIVASFKHRWLFAPDDFVAHPGEEPPPVEFDPSRQQRFVMLDSVCRFGDGSDGFRGFGSGHTLPVTFGGKRYLLAGAVGAVLEGFGKFAGRDGVYTYCGSFTPGKGFTGNVLLRMLDPDGRLRNGRSLPDLQPIPDPDPDFTYIVFRSQKKSRTAKTSFRLGPDGLPTGLHLEPQMRRYDLDCGFGPRHELRSVASVGPVIGSMTADITFNLLNPGAPGTNLAPIPFSNYDVYRFATEQGKSIGSFAGDGSEGRTFQMRLAAPGQQALRFGGFGPILNGAGAFAGIEGMMAHNSAVGIAPHALATLFLIRIHDPGGSYRLR